jgi:RsiW-degrading membrane proteinase PrsW (M82 family)
MPGIYGMAVLTILLTGLLCVITLKQLTGSIRRYGWLLLVGLPLSLMVNRFIKTPLVISVAAWTGTPLKLGLDAPFWFIFLIWLNAPLFEEAIKLFPILLPISHVFLKEPLRRYGRDSRWEWVLVWAKQPI